jgi:hypothetical protein
MEIVLCIVIWLMLFVTQHNSQYCGYIEYSNRDFVGGHSLKCFVDHPIGFEACKLILQASNECNALSYSNAKCSLHNRTLSSFKYIKSHHNATNVVSLLKLHQHFDECIITNHTQMTLIDKFNICLKHTEYHKITNTQWKTLPLLGIVITVTSKWYYQNQNEVNRIVSNMKCYSDLHDYHFVRIYLLLQLIIFY